MSIVAILVLVVSHALVFTAGALVGRRNPKKVAVVDNVYKDVGQKVDVLVKKL